jgi:hypothetical protein
MIIYNYELKIGFLTYSPIFSKPNNNNLNI